MKKQKVKSLTRMSADQIAKNLRSQFPKNKLFKVDKAYDIANTLARNLFTMNHSDVNNDIFSAKELKKSMHTWLQVKNILAK